MKSLMAEPRENIDKNGTRNIWKKKERSKTRILSLNFFKIFLEFLKR